MTSYPYSLFNKSPLQLRRIGARGGKAYGRNRRRQRALMALLPQPSAVVAPSATRTQTTAEDAALLDAQFPWLRRAKSSRRSSANTSRDAIRSSSGCTNARLEDAQYCLTF